MRVFVTGGTGFVGTNLVRRLTSDGHYVMTNGRRDEQSLPSVRVFFPTDFTELSFNNVGKVDVLFHQAAINDTTLQDRSQMFRVNVTAALKLFNDAVAQGCKKIVYASSTAAYGNVPAPFKEDGFCNPLNPYGESKKALDEHVSVWAKDHPDVVIVGLRYCNVYGPHESHKGKRASMIYQLAQQMVVGNPKIFKYGEQKRDYIYVGDVVEANLLAAQASESCIVNCGGGVATSFNEVIRILNSVLGTNRSPEYIDNPYEAAYQSHTECDMRLAREKIGFVPMTKIEEGIKKYFESGWLVKQVTL